MVPVLAQVAIERSSTTSKHKLTDLVTITNGYSYTSAELVDESDTALVNLKNFATTGGLRLDGLKPLDAEPKPAQILTPGDILVAKTEQKKEDPEIIGSCIRMPRLQGYSRFAASLDLAIIRPRSPLPKEALLALLSVPSFRQHCLKFVNGTTVLHLSKDALPAYTLTMPDDEQISNLTANVAALGELQDSTLTELHGTTAMHDFLLPRLLSGELRVSEAEENLEEAS